MNLNYLLLKDGRLTPNPNKDCVPKFTAVPIYKSKQITWFEK